MLSVKVLILDEEVNNTTKKCTTQQYIVDAAKPILIDRFSGAFSLKFYSGRLFDNTGFIDDSECVQHVLEGTYGFPEGIDHAIKILIEECSIMYLSMSREEACTFVKAEDYQYDWKRVKEHISASCNILHFRHCIAAADSESLSELHAAKISKVYKRGVPLARWGLGVTILLDNNAGVILVNKLRAI